MQPKPFAFVLMPFEEAFRDIYLLGIKPACEEAGYYCERLDEQIFDETMLDRIYNQIAKADLVVADLSMRNPNVFYETGYAHGIGQRVILLTKNSDDIPFDLKHHFHIVYSDSIVELKTKLRQRAVYYLANPMTPTRNPFDQLTVLFNGEPIDFGALVVRRSVVRDFDPSSSKYALTLDFAFHLREAAVDNELDVDVRLITRSKFDRSGWRFDRGSSQLYTTIAMPDGRVMHKPLNAARVCLGDADKIVFDLYTDRMVGVEPMTLRLISSGLRRDVALEVETGQE